MVFIHQRLIIVDERWGHVWQEKGNKKLRPETAGAFFNCNKYLKKLFHLAFLNVLLLLRPEKITNSCTGLDFFFHFLLISLFF